MSVINNTNMEKVTKKLNHFELLLDNWNAEVYIQSVRYGGDGKNCYAMLIHDYTPYQKECSDEFWNLVGDYAETFLNENKETYLVWGENAHEALKNLEIAVNKSNL